MNPTDATTANTNTVHAMEAVSAVLRINRLIRSTDVAVDYAESLPPTRFQKAAPSWPLDPPVASEFHPQVGQTVQLENGTHYYPPDIRLSIKTC
jgi:hypothetical protein